MPLYITNNVTTVSEVRSASTRLFAGMWRPWWVLLQHSIMLRSFFIIECDIGTLSLRYACIRSSSIILVPFATYVSNFVSFTASIAELGHDERSHTQSLNQSLTQLIWCPRNQSIEALALWKMTLSNTNHSTGSTWLAVNQQSAKETFV